MEEQFKKLLQKVKFDEENIIGCYHYMETGNYRDLPKVYGH
jgi:hypothetical protein